MPDMTHEDLVRTVTEAVRAHQGWPDRLKRAVAEGVLPIPAHDIACEDQCGFGRWLLRLRTDPEIDRMAVFQDVIKTHALLHAEAGRIAKFVETGNPQQADAALEAASLAQAAAAFAEAGADWSVAQTERPR